MRGQAASGAFEPDLARFGVEVLDRTAGRADLVGAHRGVADEDDAIVAPVGIEEVAGRRPLLVAAAVVLPHALVEAIVEVEMLEPLELALRGGEQLLRRLDVPVHRAADVEEQQHLDRVAPLRPQLDVDVALVGGRADRAVEVEFLLRALAREAPQAAQRELDVARPEFRVAVEVLELALVPDLDRAAPPAPVLADAHALRDGRRRRRTAKFPPVPIHFEPPWWRPFCSARRWRSVSISLSKPSLSISARSSGLRIALGHAAQPFLRHFLAPRLPRRPRESP